MATQTPTIDSQVHAYERDRPERPWSGFLPGPAEVTGDDMVAAMDAVGVDGALLHLVEVVDELIAGADTGLKQQQPGRVSQCERQHRSRPTVQRMPVRKGHVGEVQRHHVFT